MGKSKYPTPEVAVSHFTTSVTDPAVQARWGTRAAEGAGKLGDWFNTVLPGLYKLIAGLPIEPKDPWLERSKPVGQYIKRMKGSYQKKKLATLVGFGAGATPA